MCQISSHEQLFALRIIWKNHKAIPPNDTVHYITPFTAQFCIQYLCIHYLSNCHHHLFTARKRSLGQGNIFKACVIASVHRGEGVCPPTPIECIPPWQADSSGCTHPPGWADPQADPHGWEDPPLDAVPTGRPPRDTSKSGRYASYWNAYLLKSILEPNRDVF